MKKFTLMLTVLLLALTLNAQKVILMNQNFSGTFPPTGWTGDAQVAHWTASSSANAGGTSPELQFDWSPQYNGSTYFASANVNTTGYSTVYLEFKHALSHYSGNYTIGVATRSGGGAWTTVWSIVNPTSSLGATNVAVTISNANVGSSTFQLGFFFNGDSYNINDWWIDDVNLFIPYNVDGMLSKLTNVPYIGQGSTNITGSLKNMGLTHITGYTVNYTIDGSGGGATPVTGQNIAFEGNTNFTCAQAWSATPGTHLLKVWLSDVNGLGADSNKVNDTLTKTIAVATQTTGRFPLYEEFTSSTCSPCASFNGTTFTPFITAHGTEFSLIKYQMNWPGNGDPYYTAEGGVRRGVYGVNGVPDLFIDGTESAMTSGGMASELTAETGRSTFFVISETPTIAGTTVTVPVTVTPYLTGTFKVYVVIVEKTTTGNVSTNGETSFTHVMMKMLPNGSGTSVNFTAGTNYTNTFTQDLSSTHVEQMSDLACVVFIQEMTSLEVFQSASNDVTAGIDENAAGNFIMYPNPASSQVTIQNAENFDLKVFDMFGKLVISANKISNNYLLDVSSLAKSTYVLQLVNGDKVSTRKFTVLK
jgi:hypothetical protein